MADLDIKQLGVTLESTSGTIAFTDGVLDRTQNKSQDTINAELYAGAGIAFGDYGGGNGEVQFSIDNNGKITGWANTSIYAYKTGVLERVVGTTSLDGFITIAASDRTNGQQTLTPLVTVAKKSTYIDGASPTGDMLASAYAVKEYTGTYVTTHAYPKDSGEDIAARIGLAETDIETLNTAVADNSGRIGVLETYGTNATVIGTTTYDEWSVIVGG